MSLLVSRLSFHLTVPVPSHLCLSFSVLSAAMYLAQRVTEVKRWFSPPPACPMRDFKLLPRLLLFLNQNQWWGLLFFNQNQWWVLPETKRQKLLSTGSK